MTRWFMLRQSTTYDWRSKRSGQYYQFVGDKIVAVNDARDQERFIQRPEHFVEVDERGNIIDQKTGQTRRRSAFSRRGMTNEPRSYSKLAKPPAQPQPLPPAPEPAPRKVVSSNKVEEAPPAPEPVAKTPEPPAQEEVAKEEVTQEEGDASDDAENDASTDTTDDASEDSAPKKRRKKSSKKK